MDEKGVEGLFETTVVEEAEAGDRAGVGPIPVEDVEFDAEGNFKEDLTGAGGGTSGDAARRGGAS